jgi:ElaB/YqjD/DUF883 family membrane-anchored ribosome-binding protein
MNNVATMSNEEIGQLRRDFDRLKADLRDVRSDLSDLTADAVRTAKAGAAEAKHRIDQTVKAASAKGKESVEAVEEQIAAHPFMSLAAVFGVGMLVGFGISRKG